MSRRYFVPAPASRPQPMFDLSAYPISVRFLIVSLRLKVAGLLGRTEAPDLLAQGMHALQWAEGEAAIGGLLNRIFAVWPRVFTVRPSACGGFSADEWILLQAIEAQSADPTSEEAERRLSDGGCVGRVDALLESLQLTLAQIERQLIVLQTARQIH